MTEPTPKPAARIFPVDTRFQKMARRPGGIPPERAIENAQRQIDDLKPEFADWLDGELRELAAIIRRVADGLDDPALLERASRGCRQLRDVGATMDFELMTFIANNLCDIFDAIEAGADYDRDAINCHVDALLLAQTEPYRHLHPDQVPEMTVGLRRVVELTVPRSER